MLEKLVKKFFSSGCISDAIDVITYCVEQECLHLATSLGVYFASIFPKNYELNSVLAKTFQKMGNYRICYEMLEKFRVQSDYNTLKECIPRISNDYIFYPEKIVSNISSNDLAPVTFTITTCKRLDLFEQTINSFLNCCMDISQIGKWICVDDNSSEEDRARMRKLYPFFVFVEKDQTQKGHSKSMNIIRDMVTTPYIFHMEDDWKFFARKNYIGEMLEILNVPNTTVYQVLVNRNYAETENDFRLCGGIDKSVYDIHYILHEYASNGYEQANFDRKYNKGLNCAYWPHFSFRPSMLKTCVFKICGPFSDTAQHFERDYSDRYVKAGFTSAFLPGIFCLHIGRLTTELNDTSKKNAYILNNVAQFDGKKKGVFNEHNTFVINLDRRKDRLKEMEEKCKMNDIPFTRFAATDGKLLTPSRRLQHLFEGNDHKMRAGIVGCAMSHLYLLTKLANDTNNEMYMILEDDISFTENFQEKLYKFFENFPKDWELCFLGFHERKSMNDIGDKTSDPVPLRWDVKTSFEKSLGGTGGYIISKLGAKKFLAFICYTGMTNGIDTMYQKSCDLLKVYYPSTHLILADCWDNVKTVDTDIQHEFTSLSGNFDTFGLTRNDRLMVGNRFSMEMYDATPSVTNIRPIIPVSGISHVYEACKEAGLIKDPIYPFDIIDTTNTQYLIDCLLSLYDKDVNDVLTDFLSDLTYDTRYDGKRICKNAKVSFPHDDAENIRSIYYDKFTALKDALINNPNFIICTRWEKVSCESVKKLGEKTSGKIIVINGLSEDTLVSSDNNTPISSDNVKSSDNVSIFSIPFPEHLRIPEWTREKIEYDQNVFRLQILPILDLK